IRSMAAIRLNYLQHPPAENPAPGSEAWCAAQMNLSNILAKIRFLTDSHEFDDLLQKERSPYTLFRFYQDRDSLTKALQENARAFSVNFPAYTSEVRFTDRCIRFPAFLQRCGWGEEKVDSPNPSLLYSAATGDPGNGLYFPINRVRWLTPPRDIAALTADFAPEYFSAELYHFGAEDRIMGAELYLLQNGKYRYSLLCGDKEIAAGFFSIDSPRTQIHFKLPPQQLCKLVVQSLSRFQSQKN
ncbi:MAG: hypothetical protein ACP5I1_03820, partial [Candidatus Hinthialibacter sp.]